MIPILGDLHAGVRDGNRLMMKHQLDYLELVFIPYLLENGINEIIQTGDVFDVRKYTNTEVLAEWKRRFFDVLLKHNISMIVYVGNHDLFYKNKISPNSVTENLGSYKNITIIEKPTELIIQGMSCLFVPWICGENEDDCMDAIRNSKADICFGHFEIKGAKMESSTCTDGLPLSTFNRYKRCISGHFHIAGSYENVQYVGTNYQTSWGDYGIDKGLYVIDPKSLDLQFIKNEREIFHRITYNEDVNNSLLVDGMDYTDQYLKVVIEHRIDFKRYEAWLLTVENCGASSLTVIEPFLDRDEEDCLVEVDGELNVASTADLIKDYIEDVYPEKKVGLQKLMLGLHSNAQRIYG